jgi:hypothetical protein
MWRCPPTRAFLAVLALPAAPASAACDTTCGLADYNRDVLVEYLVNNNTAPLEAAALDSFFAMTPAGIETREQVLATNVALEVTDADVYTHRIEVAGDTAVLAGKIVATGTLGGNPMPELGFLAVYTMQDGEWHLMARSLVPLFAGPPAGP